VMAVQARSHVQRGLQAVSLAVKLQLQLCRRALRRTSYADTTAISEQASFARPFQADCLQPQLACLIRTHDRDSASSLARAPVTRSCASKLREARPGMGLACMQPASPHPNKHGAHNTLGITATMSISCSPAPKPHKLSRRGRMRGTHSHAHRPPPHTSCALLYETCIPGPGGVRAPGRARACR